MILVDTGYFVALLRSRDNLHARAAAWMGHLSDEPLLTLEHVLWELVNGFSKPVDRPIVHEIIDDVRRSANWEIVRTSENLFEEGLGFHRRSADKEWSLTDCIAFVVMRERGIKQALTYDHHFEQAGFEALLRRDPP